MRQMFREQGLTKVAVCQVLLLYGADVYSRWTRGGGRISGRPAARAGLQDEVTETQ